MYEGPIQDLIDELSRLPGIGPKSAQRLAFYIVKAPAEDAHRSAEALGPGGIRHRSKRPGDVLDLHEVGAHGADSLQVL